jgi:cytoskeletal protein RodZ
MSKGRYVNKKKSYISFWLILVIAVILIGAVLLLVLGSQREDIPSETEGQSALQTEGQTISQTDAAGQTGEESGTDIIGNSEETDAVTAPDETAATDPEAD